MAEDDAVDGYSVILKACEDGNADKLRELTASQKDLKKDANHLDPYGSTPIKKAIWGGYCEVVKLLVQAGAKINGEKDDDKKPLHYAVENERYEIVEYLIQMKANINITGAYGWTPLVWAIKRDNVKIVDLLIKNGAKVNLKDYKGQSPLYHAQQLDEEKSKNKEQIIELLKANKARI